MHFTRLADLRAIEVGAHQFAVAGKSAESAPDGYRLQAYSIVPIGNAYYLDPVNGSIHSSGDAAHPWGSLTDVFAAGKSFQSGDTLFLRTGNHGSPTIQGMNADTVTIRPEPGHQPTIKNLSVRAASHWVLQDLTISPETARLYDQATLVDIGADASNITVKGCRLYSVRDSSRWSKADWLSKACHGVRVEGSGNILIGNSLLNVSFGITCEGECNLVERNVIANFCRDGLRGQGDHNAFLHNVVKNSYNVQNKGQCGFKSLSYGPEGLGSGVVRGIVLRGNTILNTTDPDQPFKGNLQGIGCFRGFYEDWIVENNVVIVNHWHGITLRGAHNCSIVNNTVINQGTTPPGPPWIKIENHPGGESSTGNVIRNNLAPAYASDAGIGQRDHNVVVHVVGYDACFADHRTFDLSLRANSLAIDAGTDEGAPREDLLGTARPFDGDASGVAEWDAGAYEFTHAPEGAHAVR